ncbi:zinc finger protein castor homolog 1-like [Galendromus occidentalis]|uniref:Zinc finger protein castor homolog 1-like n=1 Tax=Galendromus occidentalis TaxID=34638 RepID=A0AAJ6QND9_9ACAR|nr:zinc finger protein castor homolog 1-like [Galendromus occidentalis]
MPLQLASEAPRNASLLPDLTETPSCPSCPSSPGPGLVSPPSTGSLGDSPEPQSANSPQLPQNSNSKSFNKRKNFQPKSIQQDEVASTTVTDAPLDLSGEPSKRTMPPTESEIPTSVFKDYAENAVKEFLAMYGFNDAAEGILKHLPNTPFPPGKLLEMMSSFPGAVQQQPNTFFGANATNGFAPAGGNSREESSMGANVGGVSAPLSPASSSSCSSLQEHQLRTNGLQTSSTSPYPQSPDRIRDAFLANRLSHQMFPPSMCLTSNLASSSSMMTPPPQKGSTSFGAASSLLITPPATLSKPTNANTAKDGKNAALDYSRYIRRYPSSKHCGNNYCKDLNYREHYHCLDCNFRVFVKKEEMIRHFKWHKKRDESLTHGFLRYSPSDDCSIKFPDCVHNRKQTHYHCMHDKCDKCYISTSDVQMHSNYHKKDIAIIQEGFQRFRATEDCETPACQFYNQRTTHFHCIRDNCSTTFKNKADIEKHKTYHIKDEQLAKDGFRKFMKHEPCVFAGCRFNLTCNHIHCIRPGCNFVLQSSGQLYSHKRKHERQDNELAYRKMKLAQSMLPPNEASSMLSMSASADAKPESPLSNSASNSILPSSSSNGNGSFGTDNNSGRNMGFANHPPMFNTTPSINFLDDEERLPILADEDTWTRYMNRYPVGDVCKSDCDLMYREHYHCITDNCTAIISAGPSGESREANEHAASHEYQDRITQSFFHTVGKSIEADCTKDCPYYLREKHYHCLWPECGDILSSSEAPFKRLEHFKFHDINDKNSKPTKEELLARTPCATDSMNFPKKRGRPAKLDSPKTPVPTSLAVALNASAASVTPLSGQLTYKTLKMLSESRDGFKLSGNESLPDESFEGFDVFQDGAQCHDDLCSFSGKRHFHCNVERCFYATNRDDILDLHSGFHQNIDISENYEVYDSSIDCRRARCESNRKIRHFHCTRSGCDQSFVRMSAVSAHDATHETLATPVKSEPMAANLSSPEDQRNANSSPLSKKTSDGEDSPPAGSAGLKAKSSGIFSPLPKEEAPSPLPKEHSAQSLQQHFSGLLRSPSEASSDSPGNLLSPARFPALLWGLGSPQSYMPGMLSLSDLQQPNAFPLELQQQLAAQPLANPEFLYGTAGSAALGGDKRSFPFAGSASPPGVSKRPRTSNSTSTSSSSSSSTTTATGTTKSEEPVPEGYLKFRFNEDCGFASCSYREHQTHFHCTRLNCNYSFCDKTRFSQHSARHERTDSVMGDEFQQYRANLSCGRADCAFNAANPSNTAKASHYHCTKCDFVCADTNKVAAHRKRHAKLESVTSPGFAPVSK